MKQTSHASEDCYLLQYQFYASSGCKALLLKHGSEAIVLMRICKRDSLSYTPTNCACQSAFFWSEKQLGFFRLEGNPGLCLNTTCTTVGKKSSNVGIIVGVVAGVLLLVGIAIGVVVFMCCRRRSAKAKSPISPPLSQIGINTLLFDPMVKKSSLVVWVVTAS